MKRTFVLVNIPGPLSHWPTLLTLIPRQLWHYLDSITATLRKWGEIPDKGGWLSPAK